MKRKQVFSEADLDEALLIARQNYRFLSKRDAEGIIKEIIAHMNNGVPYKNAVIDTLNRFFPNYHDYKKAYISLASVYFGKRSAKKRRQIRKKK